MAAGEIHVGDIGTQFLITVKDENGTPIDLSTKTTLQMIFNVPGRSPLVVNASFVNSGTDGQISYTTVSGNLSVAGEWTVEVFYVLASGESKHTDTFKFTVFPNLATS